MFDSLRNYSNVGGTHSPVTHIFFDDSHHERGDFSVGAFAFFSNDPADQVHSAIERSGLVPWLDEYKSRHPHSADPRWIKLRRSLFQIADQATIGLVVAPFFDRARFGLHALMGLAHIVRANNVRRPVVVMLDEGLYQSDHQFHGWRNDSALPSDVVVTPECDSKSVPGIQVADLIALGVSDKALHSAQEGEWQLSFEMWAKLRYNFFCRPIDDPSLREAANAGLVDSHHGLYIAPGCTQAVASVADARFGETWLGCIH
jgi:hypothetical protein